MASGNTKWGQIKVDTNNKLALKMFNEFMKEKKKKEKKERQEKLSINWLYNIFFLFFLFLSLVYALSIDCRIVSAAWKLLMRPMNFFLLATCCKISCHPLRGRKNISRIFHGTIHIDENCSSCVLPFLFFFLVFSPDTRIAVEKF